MLVLIAGSAYVDRTSALNVKQLKEHRAHDFEIELFLTLNLLLDNIVPVLAL